MGSSPDDGSDMSVEDAAAIQQDLAGGRSSASAAAPSPSQQQQQGDAAESYNDDPRDAPTMSMLADIAGAGSQVEQQQPQQADTTTTSTTTHEDSSAQSLAAPAQAGDVEEAQVQTQQAQEEVLPQSLAPSASTNASLDALLGSLAESHNNSTMDEEAADVSALQPNQDSASESVGAGTGGHSMEAVSQEVQPAAVASTTQEQDTTATKDETMTDTPNGNQEGNAEGLTSQSTDSTNLATFVPPDAFGPVPGLPDSISINATSSSSTGQDASTDAQASGSSIPQIRQEATPAGTPTLAPATLTATITTPSQSHPHQGTTSATSFTAPPSSTSSTPVLKITQLASDPNLALSTAQQLLSSRPQTLSRLQKLRKRIETNKFDGEAWLELINDALQKGDLDRTREVYDQFLMNFPDNVRQPFLLFSLSFRDSLCDVCADVHVSLADEQHELTLALLSYYGLHVPVQLRIICGKDFVISKLGSILTIAHCFCSPFPRAVSSLNRIPIVISSHLLSSGLYLLDSTNGFYTCYDFLHPMQQYTPSLGSRMDRIRRFRIVTW